MFSNTADRDLYVVATGLEFASDDSPPGVPARTTFVIPAGAQRVALPFIRLDLDPSTQRFSGKLSLFSAECELIASQSLEDGLWHVALRSDGFDVSATGRQPGDGLAEPVTSGGCRG
jgi:hypothetical protein